MPKDILKVNKSHDAPIGIFDSGIGGLSVLSEIKKRLPNESIYYLSDRENAPYGCKSAHFIEKRSEENVRRLISLGCKLVVIACNTATAVSIEKIRKKFDYISVVGLEPALRPAAEKFRPSEILVLATPLTLSQKRFNRLKSEFESDNESFCCVAAQETVCHVENLTVGSIEHIKYLESILAPFKKIKFSACVLGCTHFPFASSDICKALGYQPEFFDGGKGSAKRVEVLLKRENILNNSNNCGKLLFSDNYCSKRYSYLFNQK